MSAGASPAGRQFAATHADICFVSAPNLEGLRSASDDIHARAAEIGRTVQIWTTAGVLCGETEADVKRQYDYFVHETGDWVGAETTLRELLSGGSRTLDIEITKEMIESRIFGSFGHRLMGTPEQVVVAMQQLVDAGIDGVAAVWFDYEAGIAALRDLVFPLAIDAGIRAPIS